MRDWAVTEVRAVIVLPLGTRSSRGEKVGSGAWLEIHLLCYENFCIDDKPAKIVTVESYMIASCHFHALFIFGILLIFYFYSLPDNNVKIKRKMNFE